MVQLARVIYSNIYREDDRPECKSSCPSMTLTMADPVPDRRGNRVLVGIACMNICVYMIAKGFYMWKNKTRDKEWAAMTEEVSRSAEAEREIVPSIDADRCSRSAFIISAPPRMLEARRRTSASSTKWRGRWSLGCRRSVAPGERDSRDARTSGTRGMAWWK